MSGFLHFNDLEDDLYTLLSVVTGDQENQALLAVPEVQRCLPHLIGSESMVESLLISLAVRLRMVEDRFQLRGETVDYPYPPDQICRFVQGQGLPGDASKSGLRLACDKIVHANQVSFYADQNYDTISIEGMNRNAVWQVSIDMRKFAVSGLCLAAQYEDNWRVSSRNVEHGASSEPVVTILTSEEDTDTEP